jgi:hypothetical protein
MLAVQLPQSTITSVVTKNRCICCNKKLGLLGFTCRCGGNFCAEHRHDSAHNCTYDYQGDAKNKLSKELSKVIAEKLERV